MRKRGHALVAELGARARFVEANLADPSAPPTMIEATVKAFGRLDGIVNNAACVARNDLLATDAAFFDNMIAVNVLRPLLLIRAAYPHLKASQGCVTQHRLGQRLLGRRPSTRVQYFQRRADDDVAQSGRCTLLRPIRVNHFNVGWVLSPNEYKQKITDGFPPDWPEHVDPVVSPSGRIMPPEEIAAAAVYWLSDESRPISGSVVELEQYPIIGRNPTKKGE